LPNISLLRMWLYYSATYFTGIHGYVHTNTDTSPVTDMKLILISFCSE